MTTEDELATARAEAAALRAALVEIQDMWDAHSCNADPYGCGSATCVAGKALAADAGRAALEAVKRADAFLQDLVNDDGPGWDEARDILTALRAAFPGVGE